eukprot:12421114-Karenia_brevis.AAC.1
MEEDSEQLNGQIAQHMYVADISIRSLPVASHWIALHTGGYMDHGTHEKTCSTKLTDYTRLTTPICSKSQQMTR